MSEKKYYIHINGTPIEVTEEVYKAYYQFSNHAEYLEKKDKKKGKVLFSDLDTSETLGEAIIPDNSMSVEDLAIASIITAKLRYCISLLPLEDQALIQAVFYNGLSEREYADLIGVSQNAVHKRKRKIIKKLKEFFKK